MTCSNPQALLMNNTRITSASDAIYIMASPDVDGVLKTLLVRPVSRRVTLPIKPFTSNLVETDSCMHFDYAGVLEVNKSLSKNEERALDLFELGEDLTVNSALQRAAQLFSDKTMRELLHSLEDKGYLKLVKRIGKGGRLQYQRIM